MNRKELIDKIAADHQVTKKQAKWAYDSVMSTIATELASAGEGFSLVLDGIGTLAIIRAAERKGRNPQTGEELMIPEHNKPVMKFSAAMKAAVRDEEI